GSNPRPSAWEADALPTELLPLKLPGRGNRIGIGRVTHPLPHPPSHNTPTHHSHNHASAKEPPVRIELTTARLRIECSTSELRWRAEPVAACLPSPRPFDVQWS